MSNLLRIIHTMKPPKKKKKKKACKATDASELASKSLDPVVEERKKRFPGLSLPDDTERVQKLLELDKREGLTAGGVKEENQDVKIANEALNEVSAMEVVGDSEVSAMEVVGDGKDLTGMTF